MKCYRVILDTNVILAAMRSQAGASHRLLLTIGHPRWQSVIQQPVNIFALRRLEDCARAGEDFSELERRAQRGSRENFEAAMAKVAKVAPAPGDETR